MELDEEFFKHIMVKIINQIVLPYLDAKVEEEVAKQIGFLLREVEEKEPS